ncbi:MAG: hypothetical protein V2A78_13855 [bacterium]
MRWTLRFFWVLFLLSFGVAFGGPQITGTLKEVLSGGKMVVIRQADGNLRKVKFLPKAEFYRQSLPANLNSFTCGEQVVVHVPGALNDEPLLSDRMSDLATMAASRSGALPQPGPLFSPGGMPGGSGPALMTQPAPMFSPVIGEVLSGSGNAPPAGPLQGGGGLLQPGSAGASMGLPGLMGAPSSPQGDAMTAIAPPDEKENGDDDGESRDEGGIKVFEGKVNQIDARQGLLYIIQIYPPDLVTVRLTARTLIRERSSGKIMQLGQIRLFDIVSVTGQKKGGHEIEAVNIMVIPQK